MQDEEDLNITSRQLCASMALASFEPGLGPGHCQVPGGPAEGNFAPRLWSPGREKGARGPRRRPARRPRIPRLGRGALTSAHPAFQRVLAEVDPVHVHMRLAARVDCPNDALWQPGPSGFDHAEARIPELRQEQQQQQSEKRHSGCSSCPGPQHGGHHCGGSPCRPSSSAGREAAPDSVKQRHGPFCLSNPGHVALGPPPLPRVPPPTSGTTYPAAQPSAWTLQPIRVRPSLITHHPVESGPPIGACVQEGGVAPAQPPGMRRSARRGREFG